MDPPNEAIFPTGGALTHFAYDAAGNRTDFGPKSGSTWLSPHTTYDYDARKRLTKLRLDGVVQETFGSYDPNGNPTTWTVSGTARTLRWDALGRLVEITGAFAASYVYDPFGRRIQRTESGSTTLYQYDGLDVVAEYDGGFVRQAIYVFGPGIDEVLKIKRGAASPVVAAYHTDGLGSVVALTVDGTFRNTYRYDAFGKLVAQGGNTPLANAYTYTGRERDASGLYYYRARYYLASAGRFLTPDPIGLAGGVNPYVYVGSNPVNFTDPFGLAAGAAFGPAVPALPSGLAQAGYFGLGLLGGTAVGAGAAYGFAALTAACLPCAVAVGGGLLAYGAYDLGTGGLGEIAGNVSSLASGSATPEQAFATGFLVGGVVGGVTARPLAGSLGREAGRELVPYYPSNRGFASGDPARATLVPGTVVDRYGAPSGTFVSPQGTPPWARSLPFGAEQRPLNAYEVVRPIEVDVGTSAPWFHQPGGGVQYDLGATVQELVDKGLLNPIR